MPRKTKETPEIEKEVNEKVVKKLTAQKPVATKKSTTKAKSSTAPKADEKANKIDENVSKKTSKATTVKKADSKTKKVADKKIEKEVKKSTTKKPAKSQKKADTKESAEKKSTAKATKKATARKSPTKVSEKKVTPKTETTKTSNKFDIVEYYDLPYRYNQTIVKVLAQTPSTLFIYWDISDDDRENYKRQFGDNFFETTKPVLKIFNDTMNYSFEVEINDFANSWYLHINDAKCDYRIELGRRPIYNPADIGGTDYVFISSSNEIEAPNDRILIDKFQNMVYFRNVKTNQCIGKSFANFSFLRNMGKIYNIYDLYKELYKDEDLEDIYNPSSRFF